MIEGLMERDVMTTEWSRDDTGREEDRSTKPKL